MKSVRNTLTVLAAVAATACSPSTLDSPAPSGIPAGADASSPSEASAPAPDPSQASAIAAYRGMWKAFADAAATGEWTSPHIAQYATGEALSALTQGIKADHDRGWVSKGQPVLNPSVKTVFSAEAPREVLVVDCGDSTNWIRYQVSSGHPVANDPRGRRHIEARVAKQADGAWRVVKFAVQGIGTC